MRVWWGGSRFVGDHVPAERSPLTDDESARKRADAMCAPGDRALAPLFAREPKTKAAFISVTDRIGRQMLLWDAKLRAIPPAHADASQVRTMLDDWDESGRLLVTASRALRAGQVAIAGGYLKSATDLNLRANAIARDLDVPRCADMGAGVSAV